jgi:hypothetical protein
MIAALAASCAVLFTTLAAGLPWATKTGPDVIRKSARGTALTTEAQQLEPTASAVAGRPLTVLCYRFGEPGDPLLWGGWGYVDLFRPIINLSKEACDGALAIVDHDVSVPLIEQALGALSLTHESYHLNLGLPFARRASEAQTECRSIKRVRQTILELGASPELADAMLPWSIAAHFKKSTISRAYDWPGCRVPVFAEFWP